MSFLAARSVPVGVSTRTLALLGTSLVLIAGATAWLWPDGNVANTDCDVELLSKATSPDGTRLMEYRARECLAQ